jgi:hypothetical protein
VFLSAAVDNRLQHQAGPCVESGDALGRVHLVLDDGEQIHVQRGDVDRPTR